MRKNGLRFRSSFLYVCPEPVLAEMIISIFKNRGNKDRFLTSLLECEILRENGTFFEFSLCLSRACLGKIIIFIYKWRKKTVLSPVPARRGS
eukprot:COSAG06_NODE_1364_length_9696_cov_14.104929_7_plen_92_part_00